MKAIREISEGAQTSLAQQETNQRTEEEGEKGARAFGAGGGLRSFGREVEKEEHGVAAGGEVDGAGGVVVEPGDGARRFDRRQRRLNRRRWRQPAATAAGRWRLRLGPGREAGGGEGRIRWS